MDAGHPAVARPWSEVRGQIEGACDADRDDPGRRFQRARWNGAGMGQKESHRVKREADHNHVRERPKARPLTEWDPPDEHEHAHEDRGAADVEATVVGNSFGEHRPGRVSKTRIDQRRLPDPEQPETEEQDRERDRAS